MIPNLLSVPLVQIKDGDRSGFEVFSNPFLGWKSCEKKRAFSLVEILVAIAIMVILMAIVVPASSSLMGGMNVSSSAAMVNDELNFARQTALSRNRDVEVRFYKLGSKLDDNDKKFRAFRSFLIDGVNQSSWKPLSRVKKLSEPVIISGDPTYSTLLDAESGNVLGEGNENLPGSGSAEYVSFLFRANGDTSLKPVTKKWYLTLYSEKAVSASGLPPNYFTVQIDPVTGRTRSFRP